MTESDLLLFALVATLGINHVATRLTGWENRMWLFWPAQVTNLAAGSFLLAFGIPDFKQGDLRIVNWMIGLLFLFHVINNNRRLQAARQKTQRAQHTQDSEEKNRIRAALRRGEE